MKYKFCPQCSAELMSVVTEHRVRLTCSKKCGYVFWNNPTPVVAIVVETAHGIVLAHNRNFPAGIFSVITGFLESKETPEVAAVREVKEELDLDVVTLSFIGNFVLPELNQLIIAFHAQAEGQVVLNDELDTFKLVSKEDLVGWEESQRFDFARWLKEFRVLK